MKNILLKSILFIFIPFLYSGITASYSQNLPLEKLTYQDFYDLLSPHGTWLYYPKYGNVWHPDVDREFRPYMTDGYWIYTDDGWYWYSIYTWGWIPFHYGTWIYDDSFGWLWIPGHQWAPAWVLWGEMEEYICWAPLPPDININNWRPNAYYWNIIQKQYFTDRHVEIYQINRKVKEEEAPKINIIYASSDYAPRGPDASTITEYAREIIVPISLNDIPPPKDGNERTGENVNMELGWIYRGNVDTTQEAKPAVVRIVNEEAAKPLHLYEHLPTNNFRIQQKNIRKLPIQEFN